MVKALVIVESPAKIKTLRKFLGPNYILESSVGHIIDLPQKEFGIDVEKDFEPTYVTMPDKQQVIQNLKKAAKEVDVVYLCPDPDREGEAIAWHIASILPKKIQIQRATFNAITKDAVLEALSHPREIDMSLVNAQQTRRLLDRIVGYKISPILSRRVQRRTGPLSAGRVQSVALKLVVDREKEIEAFKPIEYWDIAAFLHVQEVPNSDFEAYLHSVDGKRVEKEPSEGKEVFLINNQQIAEEIVQRLQNSNYIVEKVEKKERKRQPVPPFITSTLQQEASRHFSYSSSRTMTIAQGLYEGIDLGQEGAEGLITYMRTDSVRVVPEAIQSARQYISSIYGESYLPENSKIYASKGGAQDAHEAIRPTDVNKTPEKVRPYLTEEQFRLYTLIWRRFVSSQMAAAVYDTITADIKTSTNCLLRATGSTLKFNGFLAVYEEKKDDEKVPEEEQIKLLPFLKEGQNLNLLKVTSNQAFTKPPARFTEALLVKELEKSGIGRPSTYASIMNKIQSRDYTTKENNRLKPTELGKVIASLLEENFTKIMDVNFTAMMEDRLEQVASNTLNWKSLLKDFWSDFIPLVEKAEESAYVPKIDTDLECPECGKHLQKIWARSKYFYGCSNYPECEYKTSIEQMEFDRTLYAEDFNWDQKCILCEGPMQVRHGRFGAFLGCCKYPDCKGIVNIPKKGEAAKPPAAIIMPCPAQGCSGKILERRSRFGKTFYSCSTFPDCDVIANDAADLKTKYADHPRTPYQKKTKAKKKEAAPKAKATKAAKAPTEKKRNMPSVDLPDAFASVIPEKSLPRTEIVKKIWDYIKAHNLQDPKDKRIICPDAELAKIFGSSEPINMFHIAGAISKALKTD